MEPCEMCSQSEAAYICVCEEKHLCEKCMLEHFSYSKKLKHRPISVSHPLLSLMMDATEDVKNAAENFTEESIEKQIKNLENFRDRTLRTIDNKIQALKQKIKSHNSEVCEDYFKTPEKKHQKSLSSSQTFEKTTRISHASEKTKKIGNFEENLANHYKVVVIGEAEVGKSALLRTFASNGRNFTNASSMNSVSRKFMIEKNVIEVDLWEISSKNVYNTLIKSCFYKAEAVVVLFDLTRSNTFEKIREKIATAKEFIEDQAFIFIVGSKIDLVSINASDRKVQSQEAQILSRELGGFYHEISANDYSNVIELFKKIIKEIYVKKL